MRSIFIWIYWNILFPQDNSILNPFPYIRERGYKWSLFPFWKKERIQDRNRFMNTLKNKKIAIVCDWIKDWWGAELVLTHMLEIFPDADIFTSVFWQEWNPVFEGRKITTSFIQKIPILNKSHKLALTLRPLAFERFDLSAYDIVISSTSAESKWVITKPECLHICYCHTPTRYFWSHYHEFRDMMEFWILNPLAKCMMPAVVHKLRQWDFCAAQRPDIFLANSKNTQTRITKYYKRESIVLYPWIDINCSLFPLRAKERIQDRNWDFYLSVGRCIPYKKFDLLVDAFNKNGKKLVLVTNTDNALYKKLKAQSKSNIIWKLNISREETVKLYSQARAFVFPPEEDFGLVPLEAQACGTPVIAYEKWGALETVIEWKTGVFFDAQTSENLNRALEYFETLEFDSQAIRQHAEKFSKAVFQQNLLGVIAEY